METVIAVSDEQFQELINAALESLPGEHAKSIANVAILYQQDPTPDQRTKLSLRDDQTLLGLYEGVSLTRRQGNTSLLPDKITIFKSPMELRCSSLAELQEQIRHTLWHEIGHYYGLGHDQIRNLE